MLWPPQRTRRVSKLVLLGSIFALLALLIYPMYVIRPFRAQGPRELAAALAVLQARPAVDSLLCLAALAACVLYWSVQPRWWKRALAIAGALFACGFTFLARINVYELMFHPDAQPVFSAASSSKLDKDEKVIAVNLDGAARAYPIRIISYHHVINDVLGKTAIVATY